MVRSQVRTWKGHPQTVTKNVGCMKLSKKFSWFAEALWVSFIFYTTAFKALHCTYSCKAWMQLFRHENPFHEAHTVLDLIWRPPEVWGSVAIDSEREESRMLSSIFRFYMSFHLACWVAVVSNCYYFSIIPIRVKLGIFSAEEISWMGSSLTVPLRL